MVHLGHYTTLPSGHCTSEFQCNHPSILIAQLSFFHIQIIEGNCDLDDYLET